MYQLLTDMSLERLTRFYEALPEPVSRALDAPIAQALNSRPVSVARRPLSMRVKALRAFFVRKRDDGLAGELLRAYLLGPRKDLVVGFLEATGVAHEDGQIEDDEARPDELKVPAAVAGLLEAHDPEDVALYLHVARLQWPESAAVAEALQSLTTAGD